MYLISNSPPTSPVTPTGMTVWDRGGDVVSTVSWVVMYSVLMEGVGVVEVVVEVEDKVVVVVVEAVVEDDLVVVVVVVIGVGEAEVSSVVIPVVTVDAMSWIGSGVVVCSSDKRET